MSELLDRFRPAGSPGASSAAGRPVVGTRDVELAAVMAELVRLEGEAAAVVDAARARAAQLRADATARAGSRLAGEPEACAAARAEAETQRRRALDSSLGEAAARADRETERIRSSADAGMALIVAEVLAGVRASASSPRIGATAESPR